MWMMRQFGGTCRSRASFHCCAAAALLACEAPPAPALALMVWMSHSMPSFKPCYETAEHAWIFHVRSVMSLRAKCSITCVKRDSFGSLHVSRELFVAHNVWEAVRNFSLPLGLPKPFLNLACSRTREEAHRPGVPRPATRSSSLWLLVLASRQPSQRHRRERQSNRSNSSSKVWFLFDHQYPTHSIWNHLESINRLVFI